MTNWIAGVIVVLLVVLGLWYVKKSDEKYDVQNESEVVSLTDEEEDTATVEVIDEKLVNSDWVWQRTEREGEEDLHAPEGGEFVLRFTPGGEVTSSTDCNSMSGRYQNDGEVLRFSDFVSTLMFCEGSVEPEYAQDLLLTGLYEVKDSELRLLLSDDTGVMVFTK